MTALLDFPATSAPAAARGYAVLGESAVVPGTSLRLPLAPEAVLIPVAERCADCAGTGVSFDGGHPDGSDALMSCVCMRPNTAPATLRPGERVIKTTGGILRPVPGGFPGDYYFEPIGR